MTEYLVEMYVSRAEPSARVPRSEDVSEAARQVTREGRRVRLLRSIVVPEEETCLYLYQADTADNVHEAATRAGLRFDRVVEALADWGTAPAKRRVSASKRSASPSETGSQGEMQS